MVALVCRFEYRFQASPEGRVGLDQEGRVRPTGRHSQAGWGDPRSGRWIATAGTGKERVRRRHSSPEWTTLQMYSENDMINVHQ